MDFTRAWRIDELVLITVAAISLASPAQAVTTWNWSFTTNSPNQFGSGTFTSADVVPTANAPIAISGISGTYSIDGTSYNITGLLGALDNIVYWDGSSASPIITNRYSGSPGSQGISFTTDLPTPGNYVWLFNPTGSDPIRPILRTDVYFIESTSNGADVNFSSLSPVYANVPGPLPALGAAAAFGWSRRLRSRISHRQRTPV
jgi:hypothetical protein